MPAVIIESETELIESDGEIGTTVTPPPPDDTDVEFADAADEERGGDGGGQDTTDDNAVPAPSPRKDHRHKKLQKRMQQFEKYPATSKSKYHLAQTSNLFFLVASILYIYMSAMEIQFVLLYGNTTQYDIMYWHQLPPRVRTAAQILGYTQQSWDGNTTPEESDLWWQCLNEVQKEAAMIIGYDEEGWNGEIVPEVVVCEEEEGEAEAGAAGAAGAGISTSVNGDDGGENDENKDADNELEDDTNNIDYGDLYWTQLPPPQRDAATTLGYNQISWDNDIVPEESDLYYQCLSVEQQDAAVVLGYNAEEWNGRDAPVDVDCEEEYATLEPTVEPTEEETKDDGEKEGENDETTEEVAQDDKDEDMDVSHIIPVGKDVAEYVPSWMVDAVMSPKEDGGVDVDVDDGIIPYGDLYWDQLPQLQRDAAMTLGYTPIGWDDAILPEESDLYFECLSTKQQEAAAILGYDAEDWNGPDAPTNIDCDDEEYETFEPTVEPTEEEVVIQDEGEVIDIGDIGKVPSWMVEAVKAAKEKESGGVGVGGHMDKPEDVTDEQGAAADDEDVAAKKYDNLSWNQLPAEAKDAATTLGYDAQLWNSGGMPEEVDAWFECLSAEHQEAAETLGYSAVEWNGPDAPAIIDCSEGEYETFEPTEEPTEAEDEKEAGEVMVDEATPADDEADVEEIQGDEADLEKFQGDEADVEEDPVDEEEYETFEPTEEPTEDDDEKEVGEVIVGDITSDDDDAAVEEIQGDEAVVEEIQSDGVMEEDPVDEGEDVIPEGNEDPAPDIIEQIDQPSKEKDQDELNDAVDVVPIDETEDSNPEEVEVEEAAQDITYEIDPQIEEELEEEILDEDAAETEPIEDEGEISDPEVQEEPVKDVPTEDDLSETIISTKEDPAPENESVNYDDMDWADLPEPQKAAAKALGYNKKLWDNDGTPGESDEWWDDLTSAQREAAKTLGYNKKSWNGNRRKLEEESEASTEYTAPPDPYAEEDRRYRLIYIFASLSFVVVGILDWMLVRKLYPLLFVVAGLLGFVSAFFVLSNVRVSNILDMFSVHCYFLEILFMVWYRLHGGKQYHVPLKVADGAFAIGATIEVILSYFYLFYDMADFSMKVAGFNTAAQSLWVICALIYTAFTFKSRPAMLADVQKREKRDKTMYSDEEWQDEGKYVVSRDSFCDGAMTY